MEVAVCRGSLVQRRSAKLTFSRFAQGAPNTPRSHAELAGLRLIVTAVPFKVPCPSGQNAGARDLKTHTQRSAYGCLQFFSNFTFRRNRLQVIAAERRDLHARSYTASAPWID